MADPEELYDAAVDLIAEGQPEAAVAKYREALAAAPDHLDSLHGLALALAELERFEEAIEVGKRLVELEPDDPLVYTNLSRFHQRLGNIAEAETWGAKAKVADWKQQIRASEETKE